MSDKQVILKVHGWHTECGACGYGGGWASSPANEGKPVLTPDSRVCDGCGQRFTHMLNIYTYGREGLLPIEEEAA